MTWYGRPVATLVEAIIVVYLQRAVSLGAQPMAVECCVHFSNGQLQARESRRLSTTEPAATNDFCPDYDFSRRGFELIRFSQPGVSHKLQRDRRACTVHGLPPRLVAHAVERLPTDRDQHHHKPEIHTADPESGSTLRLL